MLSTGIKNIIINRPEDIVYDATAEILKLGQMTNVKAADVNNLAIYATKATAGGVFNYALTVPAGAIAIGVQVLL